MTSDDQEQPRWLHGPSLPASALCRQESSSNTARDAGGLVTILAILGSCAYFLRSKWVTHQDWGTVQYIVQALVNEEHLRWGHQVVLGHWV